MKRARDVDGGLIVRAADTSADGGSGAGGSRGRAVAAAATVATLNTSAAVSGTAAEDGKRAKTRGEEAARRFACPVETCTYVASRRCALPHSGYAQIQRFLTLVRRDGTIYLQYYLRL